MKGFRRVLCFFRCCVSCFEIGCCKGSLGFQSVLFETEVIKGVEALSVGPSRLQWRGGSDVCRFRVLGFRCFLYWSGVFCGFGAACGGLHPDPVKAILLRSLLGLHIDTRLVVFLFGGSL